MKTKQGPTCNTLVHLIDVSTHLAECAARSVHSDLGCMKAAIEIAEKQKRKKFWEGSVIIVGKFEFWPRGPHQAGRTGVQSARSARNLQILSGVQPKATRFPTWEVAVGKA